VAQGKDSTEQEWFDYAADIVRAINEGDLDFALKDIIKSAVTRAKEAQLVPKEMRSSLAGSTQEIPTNTVRDVKGREYPVLTDAIKARARVDAMDDIDSIKQFVYGDFVYLKADFKDHAIRIPYESQHSWAGKMVVIGGIGPDKVMVHPVSEHDKGGMTLPLGGEKGFISKKFLAAYFGTL
jgi:hypothetical protein